MTAALPYLLVYLLVVTLPLGLWLGGPFTFLTPVVVFFGLPLVDQLVGHDRGETLAEGESNPWFDRVIRGWVPVQTLTLIGVLVAVTQLSLTPVEWVGLWLSTALLVGGGGINVAHELMHRKASVDRGLAEVLMTTALYPHFCIEHVHGHHRHVATPADPATSRLGESLYAFLPRTLWGGLRSAVTLERERNQRRGVGFTLDNRLVRYPVMVVGTLVAVGACFGAVGLLFFVAQAVGAMLLLEIINYVEHYGLQRTQRASGSYEPVAPRHSWNANHRVSNWWLFNLQRHADHHANASRPYYHLRPLDEGPQLPFSYPTMILVAFVPPLWRALMDERVHAARARAQAA